MKKGFLKHTLILLFTLVPIFLTTVFADPPNPPDPGGDPTGPPVGGPIGDGIGVLLVLGLAYGAYRIFLIWKKKKSLPEKKTT